MTRPSRIGRVNALPRLTSQKPVYPVLILTEITWIRTLSESPEARVAMNYLSPHSVKISRATFA